LFSVAGKVNVNIHVRVDMSFMQKDTFIISDRSGRLQAHAVQRVSPDNPSRFSLSNTHAMCEDAEEDEEAETAYGPFPYARLLKVATAPPVCGGNNATGGHSSRLVVVDGVDDDDVLLLLLLRAPNDTVRCDVHEAGSFKYSADCRINDA
jgi:hypothetical protein